MWISNFRSLGPNPNTLVYYCDLVNQLPSEAYKIANNVVQKYGANAGVDKIHAESLSSKILGTGSGYEYLRNKAYTFCSNINWSKYTATQPTDPPCSYTNASGEIVGTDGKLLLKAEAERKGDVLEVRLTGDADPEIRLIGMDGVRAEIIRE